MSLANANVDPFILAWGETSAWRSAAPKSHLLSTIPQPLLESHAATVLHVAHAVGSSTALRDHIIEQIDLLAPKLYKPCLHSALNNFRAGQRGPRFWRRLWIRRAMSQSDLVNQEFSELSLARVQMEAWDNAVGAAMRGVAQAQAAMDSVVSKTEHGRAWEVLQAHLQTSMEAMNLLRRRLTQMISGINNLLAKSALFSETCQSTPEHEDVLKSTDFTAMAKQVLAVSISGLPLSRE